MGLFLTLALYLTTLVLAIPANLDPSAITNALSPRFPVATPPLRFNIDPDVVGVACGKDFVVNINVKDPGDTSKTSKNCNTIRNYLVGADNKGNKDVDLIFTCPGTTAGPGAGTPDIQVILNTVAEPDFPEVDTTTPGTMTVLNNKDKFLVTTAVEVGIHRTSNSELVWKYITCA